METVLVSAILSALTGIACYFWGKRSQQRQDLDAHLARLRAVEHARKRAEASLLEGLQSLEDKKKELNKLSWNDRVTSVLGEE